jgi:hypothetical protein
MWSLTLPQVAATLAATLVAYDTFDPAHRRLIDAQLLNVVLVLMLTTSIIGPVLTQRFLPRSWRLFAPKSIREVDMNRRLLLMLVGVVVALGVIGAAAGGALYYLYPVQVSTLAGMSRNYLLSWSAPPGATTTELNPAYKAAAAIARSPPAAAPSPNATAGDWPSYNKTLTSERYSELSEINSKNVGKLKVLCTYDLGQYTAFESGLITVDGALIGTTEFDIFSLDPATCAVNWRTQEDYPPALLPAISIRSSKYCIEAACASGPPRATRFFEIDQALHSFEIVAFSRQLC